MKLTPALTKARGKLGRTAGQRLESTLTGGGRAQVGESYGIAGARAAGYKPIARVAPSRQSLCPALTNRLEVEQLGAVGREV
jgi:hypothetical protein